VGRPREHDDATRAALLAAAADLLQEGGRAALSVRAVADRVGVSTRAVYSLFGSMEGLLYALGEHGFAVLAAMVDTVPLTDDPVADVIAATMDGWRRWALGNPELFRLTFDRLVTGEPGARQVNKSGMIALGRLRSRVERISDAGLLGDNGVADATAQIHALCEGLTALELRGRLLGRHPERNWRSAMEALLAGYRHGPGPGRSVRGRG
jgi:AcrR family transcriptional regulator